jgi:HSP20 family protein
MSVLRYDSFRDFDRLAAQLLGGSTGTSGGPRSFPMDAYRRGDRFVVHLDLPGVDADSIDLTCEQNVLTVQAERRFETGEEDQLIVNERPQGTFSRQLFLSDNLDLERIEANYENGVLTLQLPVAEQAKPRRIEISTSGRGPQTIEGTAQRSEPSA